MVNTVVSEFGTIDILVNNAGINIPRLLVDPAGVQELSEQIWDKVMNVNVKGLFFCSQAAARVMVKKQSGVIINMSSECGLEGSEGQSVYAASKAAVNGLTRSWAKELGKHHIRVVGVAPGILEATGLRTKKPFLTHAVSPLSSFAPVTAKQAPLRSAAPESSPR